MGRVVGSSTERGYGSTHKAARDAAVAAYRPGQPCARCGRPLYGDPATFDLGHDDWDRTRYRGLEHRSCNRAAGARNGNQGTRVIVASHADRSPVCGTCGRKYHYAARLCEVCGAHYHPSGGQVRTCGRKCGVELRRRKYNGKQSSKPRKRTCDCPTGSPHTCYVRISYRNCAACGAVFISRGRTLTCSAECRAQHQAAQQAEYRQKNQAQSAETARRRNDRLGEQRGWPRGKGAYNVGKKPWNKQASRQW